MDKMDEGREIELKLIEQEEQLHHHVATNLYSIFKGEKPKEIYSEILAARSISDRKIIREITKFNKFQRCRSLLWYVNKGNKLFEKLWEKLISSPEFSLELWSWYQHLTKCHMSSKLMQSLALSQKLPIEDVGIQNFKLTEKKFWRLLSSFKTKKYLDFKFCEILTEKVKDLGWAFENSWFKQLNFDYWFFSQFEPHDRDLQRLSTLVKTLGSAEHMKTHLNWMGFRNKEANEFCSEITKVLEENGLSEVEILLHEDDEF
jgi:hypothetical protein